MAAPRRRIGLEDVGTEEDAASLAEAYATSADPSSRLQDPPSILGFVDAANTTRQFCSVTLSQAEA